jgi:phosphatidylserine decarboxylase
MTKGEALFQYAKPMMKIFLTLIPRKKLSRWVGWFVGLEIPLLSSLLARAFAFYYNINLDEAEYKWWQYASIQKLFTRRLKVGVRPLGDGFILHPADSRITSHGLIEQDQLFQVKGKSYGLKDFTLDERSLEKWSGGYFITYYLCPTDYHRVHSPVDGVVASAKHIVGDLWPVNDWSIANIDKLFSVNERVNIEIQTEFGPVLASLVGATNVGKITLSFDSNLASNVSDQQMSVFKEYPATNRILKGQELGVFNMGSTVIMLYPPKVAAQILAKAQQKPEGLSGPAKVRESLVI